MIKTILFDADGVVIRGKSFSKQLEAEYGVSTDLTTPFFLNEFSPCLVGQADLKEELEKYVKQWGWQGSLDELLEYWFTTEHHLDMEIIEYIQGLRAQGITCVIATNQEKYRADYMLKRMGFGNTFDKLYASAHLGYKKPDHEFFSQLLQAQGNPEKSEILFWDDATSNVKAARAFGITAEHYTTFQDFKETMKKYLKD